MRSIIYTFDTNERTNTINIDESDVSVINTNVDTNVTKEITIANNEKNKKKNKCCYDWFKQRKDEIWQFLRIEKD